MHIQLVALLCLFSFTAHANDREKQMQDLFAKYEKVMKQHQVELVDDVFSQKFLKDNGGKDEFIEKVKELPKVKQKKTLRSILQSWKKSKLGKVIFAKVKDEDVPAGKTPIESQFVIIEENGVLKIDGTLSDGN